MGIHIICIQEVRRDLRTDKSIKNLTTYFPTEFWKYQYTRGEKLLAGTAGQGLLTLVHKIPNGNFSIEITPQHNPQKTLRWHMIELTTETTSYTLNHFYSNPTNSKLDPSFKNALENSCASVGDLNKTRKTYPIRHQDYQLALEQYDLVELITQNTHIPKNVRGASVPTTDPDSAMSACLHDESVEFISRDCLRSDHLAFILNSDFNWPSRDPAPPEYGYRFKYSELTPESTEKEWDDCAGPDHDSIWNVFSKILMKIRKWTDISPKPPNLPPEYATKSTDEIWEEKLFQKIKCAS